MPQKTAIVYVNSLFLLFTFIMCPVLYSFQTNSEQTPGDTSVTWNTALSAKFSLNQSSYSNWQKGGDNSFAWGVLIVFNSTRESDIFSFTNKGKFNYGITKISGQDSRKSQDQIFFESILTGKKKNKTFYASLKTETQFTVGKKYSEDEVKNVSNFIDPLFIYQSAGYSIGIKEFLKIRQGVSFKQTVTRDYPFWSDNPNTEKVEHFRFERGLEFESVLNTTIMKNVTIDSKLNIFSTIKTLKTTDVKWENLISAKVNRYISTDFQYFLLYDRDFSPKIQVFQSISMSLFFDLL